MSYESHFDVMVGLHLRCRPLRRMDDGVTALPLSARVRLPGTSPLMMLYTAGEACARQESSTTGSIGSVADCGEQFGGADLRDELRRRGWLGSVV